jgi:2-polyprenyl-3-methyl-5-hydroxy-6-metoxy-1,4-benzoquinol methylase
MAIIKRNVLNEVSLLIKHKLSRPDPGKYSTIIGRGSVIPVQIEAYFLALNKYVDEAGDILDVGFGLGYGLNILAIKARNVVGIDVDRQVLDYCNDTISGRNPRLSGLMLYDGKNMPFTDDCFDVLTCVDVLEHVEDYHRFIDEMLRVCRRGVFISTPNKRPEFTNKDGTPKNYWHLREWSYPELDEIVKSHGTVDWNFINGEFSGPFKITGSVRENTLALAPFIRKK